MKKLFSVIIFNLLFSIFAFTQQLNTPINVIQGETGTSPRASMQVSTRGIVTAIIKNGFFIQTPDAEIDKSSKTSEGIFVFTNKDEIKVTVGDLVEVSGTVSEFRPPKEKYTLALTEIIRPRVNVVSKGNALPAPIVLTAIDLDPKGSPEQMERYESMRVKINSLTVSQGTTGRIDEKKGISFGDGVFYGVLGGTPRPMREAGIDLITAIGDKLPKNIPVFDMNPENLRFDSDAQIGRKQLNVAAGETLKNFTGVVTYDRRAYTILMDSDSYAAIENRRSATPIEPAKECEILIASFNLENFFDDEINSDNVKDEVVKPKEVFAGRLNKTSLAIRTILMMPDVIGVIEVENIKALQKLADKINADAVADKKPNPNYVPYLEEGNDVRGIDVGYLVKSTRVKVLEIKQLGKDVKLETSGANPNEKLFDRPSLLGRFSVEDAKTGKPFEFTIIQNHLKSYRGVADEQDGERVQNKKRLEAEWLANFVAERAKTNPSERLFMSGDFNSFQFPDGYNDLMGILRGNPNPNVLTPSKTPIKTGLINLVDIIQPNQRYSYVYDGNAQTLDHILVNEAGLSRVLRFGFARIDADFPVAYYNDSKRPERVSDHDPAVLYLSLDEIVRK